jgi:predicted RNA binding protein YcfA (HicA-like mRNA interferase family)
MSQGIKLVSGAEAVKKFQSAGWTAVRQKGSHVMLTKPGYQWTLSVLNALSIVFIFIFQCDISKITITHP